jgi:hypothetical protein
MQQLIAIPAGFPIIVSNSLLASINPMRKPETTGAWSAATYQSKNEAITSPPKESAIQIMCAGLYGSKAIGVVRENRVGKYMNRAPLG